MFNWAFKKVVKLREKVAVDLGDGDVEKPFLDHLEDLRTMIVRICITILVVTLGTFMFCDELFAIIKHPLVMAGIADKITLIQIRVTGGFMTAMNISLVAGLILSFPVLFYFVLQFVLPGLRSNEKKVIFPALGVGGGLFLLGVVFAYYVVAPRALKFFYEFGVAFMAGDSSGLDPGKPAPLYPWDVVEYVKFVCQFILIFGACFELPVVVMALVKLDVLNYKVMKTSRAWAAIIICVVAAVITPTQDALTLGLLALPMYGLYEICIWLAWWMEKKDRRLYPEYYKDQDADASAVEVADDWDNENYNPWNEDGSDDEESKPASDTAPTPQSSGSEEKPPSSPEEPVSAESEVVDDTPAKSDEKPDDGPSVEKRDTD